MLLLKKLVNSIYLMFLMLVKKLADTLSNDSISKLLSIENYKHMVHNLHQEIYFANKTNISRTKDNYYELLTEEKVMLY